MPTSTGGDFQTLGCGSQNGSSCLVCKDKEQGGRSGMCIVIPYPWLEDFSEGTLALWVGDLSSYPLSTSVPTMVTWPSTEWV